MPNDFSVLQVLLAAGTAALLTVMIQLLLRPLARQLDFLDHPLGRKDHAHPTPVTGGLAMMLGALLVTQVVIDSVSRPLYGFMLGSAVLIMVGLLDDKFDLRWWVRILAQLLAAWLMVSVGGVQVEHLGAAFGFGDTTLGRLSIPFTMFATVGLINAINMIDGADGLAGSLVLAALVMLVAAAVYAGNHSIALGTAILCGAVAGFLARNLRLPWRPHAKLFMGNAGSAFLGYVIAWVSFRLTQDTTHDVSPVLALWLIPIPVMDTLVLMLRRIRQRKSPFIADRNHIHHLMLEAGFGPTQVAVVLSAFSAVCGLVAAQCLRLDIPEPLLLMAFFTLCVLWYWMTSQRMRAVGFFRWLRAIRRPDRRVRVPARQLDTGSSGDM